MIIPDPETLLYAGDEVIVLAMVESERAIQTILVGDNPTAPAPILK
jgi:Trk K+ transport system NAD-binding subunit